MMAARDDHCWPDQSIDDDIADLWADGHDTFAIAEILTDEAAPITEAEVCRTLARQREERRAATRTTTVITEVSDAPGA